jgi:hypothetical protein
MRSFGVLGVTLLFAFSAVLALSPPTQQDRTILYNRGGAPKNWLLQDRASDSEAVIFTIALKQRNLDVLFVSLLIYSPFSFPFVLVILSFFFFFFLFFEKSQNQQTNKPTKQKLL